MPEIVSHTHSYDELNHRLNEVVEISASQIDIAKNTVRTIDDIKNMNQPMVKQFIGYIVASEKRSWSLIESLGEAIVEHVAINKRKFKYLSEKMSLNEDELNEGLILHYKMYQRFSFSI